MRVRDHLLYGASAALAIALLSLTGCGNPPIVAEPEAAAPEPSEVAEEKQSLLTGPALYEFYTDWCPGCQAMDPVVEEVIPDYEDAIDFNRYNVEADPEGRELMTRMRQGYVPAFYVVDEDDRIVDQWVGERSEEEIRESLDLILDEPRADRDEPTSEVVAKPDAAAEGDEDVDDQGDAAVKDEGPAAADDQGEGEDEQVPPKGNKPATPPGLGTATEKGAAPRATDKAAERGPSNDEGSDSVENEND